VEELPPLLLLLWARERTMSFLQMGQVRRRVVSQGVLLNVVRILIDMCVMGGIWEGGNLHARLVELVAAR